MNLPLTRARTPVVTGAVAALGSLTSTGQTPRCPRADRRLGSGRLPTRHVKPRETRCNPGSLSALDEPPSVVILRITVTICAPNLNDGQLCLLSAASAGSDTTHMSMTDPGCQRITHVQYLLRGDSPFVSLGCPWAYFG